MSLENITPKKNVITKELQRIESVGEAIANSVTHGLGALLSIFALVILLVSAVLQHDIAKIVSSLMYGSALVVTYVSSTLYHSFPHTKTIKSYLRIMDHSSIFLLIAGTYTPLALITLNGNWGWSLFAIIWSLAIFGILFKLIYKHRFEIVSLTLYLLMGWLCVVAIKPIYQSLPTSAIVWLLIGGLAYTFGIIFYAWKRPFYHTIWHLFVLIGSASHFFAILFYVIKV